MNILKRRRVFLLIAAAVCGVNVTLNLDLTVDVVILGEVELSYFLHVANLYFYQ